MQKISQSLVTPIYVKTTDAMPWPKDRVFYLLTADNLYICRNHRYFRSCVPAPYWPTELAAHKSSLRASYPKIPQQQIEQICGYFEHAWWHHGSEAIVLLAWDRAARCVKTVVPEQVASVSQGAFGAVHAIGVKYRVPGDLPAELEIFCDIHSHGDMDAYVSHVDQVDDEKSVGLHVIVGGLQWEPPQFHIESVVDGARFTVQEETVIERYQTRRSDFPDAWLAKLRVVDLETYQGTQFNKADGTPPEGVPNDPSSEPN